jgi:hypothetical protein
MNKGKEVKTPNPPKLQRVLRVVQNSQNQTKKSPKKEEN